MGFSSWLLAAITHRERGLLVSQLAAPKVSETYFPSIRRNPGLARGGGGGASWSLGRERGAAGDGDLWAVIVIRRLPAEVWVWIWISTNYNNAGWMELVRPVIFGGGLREKLDG